MSNVFSALANWVPGLLRPSVIKELYEAHSARNATESRIDRYCEATRHLYDQGCVYSAQVPLYLAWRAAHIKIPNDSFGVSDEVESLCKISQLRSLFHPTVFPSELIEAASLESTVSKEEKSTHHFVWSRSFLEMGRAYIAAGAQSEARITLCSARHYAKMERPAESADALCKIASAEKEIDLGAARVTLQAAEESAKNMWEATCGKVFRLVAISDLYFSFDPAKAEAVCTLAQREIDKMGPEDSQREGGRTQKLVDEALCRRERARFARL